MTADLGRGQCGEEGHLQEDVDHDAEDDRPDHRARDVTLGIGALPGELVGLFEAQQREDDAAGGDGGQDALGSVGVESVGRREVARVELGDGEHEDRQQRNADLPPGRRAVGACQQTDAEEVDGCDDRHQAHRYGDSGRGQDVLAALNLLPAARP